MIGSARVIQGNALALPLADESVDLCVTSPPYFGLRAYQDGGKAYDGQIGAEPTPTEFVDALIAATREMVRVLKPSGSIWVNLGDKYQATSFAPQKRGKDANGVERPTVTVTCERCGTEFTGGPGRRFCSSFCGGSDNSPRAARGGVPVKSLIGIPWRYALRAIDDLGLILRRDQIWSKPNGLPESVTDRCRSSHEYWFHFVKQPRYYSAIDEIRETYSERVQDRQKYAGRDIPRRKWSQESGRDDGNGERGILGFGHQGANPLGKLPGSVWEIPTSPLTVPDHLGVDHYACVDTDTEILTRRGWLRHDEVQAGDECAGYDLDAGMARWTTVHAVHEYPFSGDLVSVEKRDLSMRLTENHRAVVVRRGKTLVVRADEMRPTDAIPRSAAWLPDEPSAPGIGQHLAALCGWVAAEGWYQPTGCVQLSQSASVNPDKVAAIDKCIAGIPYLPRDAGTRGISYERGAYRARLKHRGARANLGSFATSQEAGDALTAERERLGIDGLRRTEATRMWKGRDWVDVTWRLPRGIGQRIRDLMPDKLLTADLANLPLHEARALFDAFVDGDGHRRPTLSADMRISIYQKRRENLDWLQLIAVRLGYRTTLSRDKDRWVLYCNEVRRPLTLRGTNGTTVPVGRERYDGIVWCPTTGTGTFIARRNGRVFITGNSFPLEWPRRIIAGWSPPGICTACGQGRRPVVAKEKVARAPSGEQYMGRLMRRPDEPMQVPNILTNATITGYACACPDTTAPTTPSVILDPFGGTGTTALAAKAAGRTGITIDMSADYCRLAEWRTTDPGQLATAMQVDKPAPVAPDQLDLLEGLLA
jgi:DNA modification methylase